MSDYNELHIGFIGGGNMAQAILRGLLQAGHKPESLLVSDPDDKQLAAVRAVNGSIRAMSDNAAVASDSDFLVLAVKPQIMGRVAADLAGCQRRSGQVLVSVAAGITLGSIGGWFGSASPAIRVMPNQPALIGQGMSCLCANGAVDAKAKAGADYLVSATGRAVWLDNEELMDAVTAVSGSGPAYFYLFMEIMAEIGEELGLSAATARTLVTQTALGAAAVANQGPETLAELRRQVTSPGGTTEAAISTLEREGIHDILRKALTAARNRSIELGKPDLS